VNIGFDMHKRSWHLTALVEGTIPFAMTMSKPDYPTFKKLLSQFDGNIVRVAYEAGPCGFELFQLESRLYGIRTPDRALRSLLLVERDIHH
jgi:hypothetical protein